MERVKGLKKLLRKLDAIADPKKIAQVVEGNAKELELKAKQFAPVDTGKLRQSIAALEIDPLTWKVYANATGLAPYAAYMEFGTGGLVEVPKELADQAIRFKGRGTKKINIRPQPFMYPALISQRRQYLQDLENLLESEIKKL